MLPPDLQDFSVLSPGATREITASTSCCKTSEERQASASRFACWATPSDPGLAGARHRATFPSTRSYVAGEGDTKPNPTHQCTAQVVKREA